MSNIATDLIAKARAAAAESVLGYGAAQNGALYVSVCPTNSRGPRKAMHQDRLQFKVNGKVVNRDAFYKAAHTA